MWRPTRDDPDEGSIGISWFVELLVEAIGQFLGTGSYPRAKPSHT
jgi:hypothetical protein